MSAYPYSGPRIPLPFMNIDECQNCRKMREVDGRNLCQFCEDLFPEYLPKEQIKKYIHMVGRK